MKKLLLAMTLICFMAACKKDGDGSGASQRLVKMHNKNGSDVYTWTIDYNGNGQITGISGSLNQGAPVPELAIAHTGNEIVITRGDQGSNYTMDVEIRYVLDANGNAAQRLEKVRFEIGDAGYVQRQFTFDTLLYEYDANGVLMKTTGSRFDSTWFNPGNEQIEVQRIASNTTYTMSDGNLTSMSKVSNVNSLNTQGGGTWASTSSEEEHAAYEYSKKYPNKTDFSNAVILNEYGVLPFPLSRHYKNMPDKITTEYITRNSSGTVTNTDGGVSNLVLEYDKFGYLVSMASGPSPAGGKLEFVYGR